MVGKPLTLPAQISNYSFWCNVPENSIEITYSRPFNLDRPTLPVCFVDAVRVNSLEISKVRPNPTINKDIYILIFSPPCKLCQHSLNLFKLELACTTEAQNASLIEA